MSQFASCDMVYHHTKKNARFFNWCVGHFYWQPVDEEHRKDYPLVAAYLWMKLPALDGRWDGSACSIPVARGALPGPGAYDMPIWGWDGSLEIPTLTPSVFHDPRQPTSRHHWHGCITAGRMVGC